MYLTEQQIRAITVGAVRILHEDDQYRFFKYTEKQVSFFEKENYGLGTRAKTTTGIRLDFHTTSNYIAFEALTQGKYEIYVNGLFAETFSPKEKERITYVLCDTPNEKQEEYRVTLIFPAHGVGSLSYLEIADGATIRAHRFDTKVLFIGDSITQGWDSTHDSLSFAYRLSFLFNANSIIQGTGGAYFHEESFDRFEFDPDTVIVALGTNDFTHYATLDELKQHADAHLSLIAKEYAGKKLYYISPIFRADQEKTVGSFSSVRTTLIESALKNGFCHIDGFSLVPANAFFYLPDQVHPNALGYAQYTENLIAFLARDTKLI